MSLQGILHSDSDLVEALDLEDSSKSCNQISHYPERKHAMSAGFMQGIVKSCGGGLSSVKACYDYHSENNSWVNSTSLMTGRMHMGASFIDNVWLLSGSWYGQVKDTTEMWTGSNFEAGPNLPREMWSHCQLTVNATHVLFVRADGQPNFLLDWTDKTWTELPSLRYNIGGLSCGLIRHPINGIEAVVAGNGNSEIFNFTSLSWRPGPDAPNFNVASYTQLSDTFVMVGGYVGGQNLDTLYKFDNVNYDWVPMEHHLQVPSRGPALATVPDNFVSCT